MRKDTFTCDVCGATKKEANHWWVAARSEIDGNFLIMPWRNADLDAMENGFHLCGHQCVQKKVGEYLDRKVEDKP